MQDTQGNLLALDGSTKELGYSIWNKETKTLIELNHFTHDPDHSLIQKAEDFENFLKELKVKYPLIDEMVLEESFTAMFGGASSAHTTAILNQINALYQYVSYKSGLKVNIITVQQSRKFAFPLTKLRAKKLSGGKNHKEQMFEVVKATLGENMFPQKTISRGTRKGLVVFEDFAMDMSDAYVVGLGFLNKNY